MWGEGMVGMVGVLGWQGEGDGLEEYPRIPRVAGVVVGETFVRAEILY
jgi:hypothetical protein